jgi:uncharacterized membrane protein
MGTRSARARRYSLLDRSFEISVALKGIDGVLELIAGIALLFISKDLINRLAFALTRDELAHDPHDFVATHVLKTAHGLSGSATKFGAVYLLSHGIVKVILVSAVLMNKLWAYPWMIAFLVLFIAYQMYRFFGRHSIGLLALSIFDAFVAWLTYLEYRKQTVRAHGPTGA